MSDFLDSIATNNQGSRHSNFKDIEGDGMLIDARASFDIGDWDPPQPESRVSFVKAEKLVESNVAEAPSPIIIKKQSSIMSDREEDSPESAAPKKEVKIKKSLKFAESATLARDFADGSHSDNENELSISESQTNLAHVRRDKNFDPFGTASGLPSTTTTNTTLRLPTPKSPGILTTTSDSNSMSTRNKRGSATLQYVADTMMSKPNF